MDEEMRATPLILAPTHSIETRLLSTAAVALHLHFLRSGVPSFILLGFGARKFPLLSMLRNLEGHRIALFYYGHGTKKTLIGSEFLNRPFKRTHLITEELDDRWNASILAHLKDSLVFTVACDSADDLGAFLVNNGVRAFVGSTKPLYIVHNLDFNHDRVPDMTDIFTTAPRRLLEGASVDQAVEDFRTRARELMSNYKHVSRVPEVSDVLEYDLRYYTVVGDGGWTWDE